MATKIFTLICTVSIAQAQYACMYADSSGNRCGDCQDYCSTQYADYKCENYMYQEESPYFSSSSDCQAYVDAVNGYSSTDMLSCSSGMPRFIRAVIDKTMSAYSSITGDSITYGEVQDKINTYIAEKGVEELEKAACAGLSDGVAEEFCESDAFDSALDAINQMFIVRYATEIIADGLKAIENDAAKLIAAIADGGAKKAHSIGQSQYFTQANVEECESSANNLLQFSKGIAAVTILLITVIIIL